MDGFQELTNKLTLLADGFRKRYSKTGSLKIDDMITLVTPPKGKLLLNPGKWKLNTTAFGDPNATLTGNGGSVVNNNCFVSTSYYDSTNKTLLNNPQTRRPLDLILHLNVISTDGNPIQWGIYGMGGLTPVTPIPHQEVQSTFHLNSGIAVDSGNPLNFVGNGNTQIDLATSYIEIKLD